MNDHVENLILEHLKAIRAEMHGIKTDTHEIRSRLTSMESALARLAKD